MIVYDRVVTPRTVSPGRKKNRKLSLYAQHRFANGYSELVPHNNAHLIIEKLHFWLFCATIVDTESRRL